MTVPCGLVIVDDAVDLRKVLVLALQRDPRLTILADVGDGEQALEAVERHRPHVVLMDVAMPVKDGITATRELKSLYPDIAVVIFTGYGDDRVAAEAADAGADVFVEKNRPLTEVADLLVAAGGCG